MSVSINTTNVLIPEQISKIVDENGCSIKPGCTYYIKVSTSSKIINEQYNVSGNFLHFK